MSQKSRVHVGTPLPLDEGPSTEKRGAAMWQLGPGTGVEKDEGQRPRKQRGRNAAGVWLFTKTRGAGFVVGPLGAPKPRCRNAAISL